MKRNFRYLSLLSAIVGLSLFVGLLYQTGLNIIVDKIRLLGLGLLFLILYSGTRHYLRTAVRMTLTRQLQAYVAVGYPTTISTPTDSPISAVTTAPGSLIPISLTQTATALEMPASRPLLP